MGARIKSYVLLGVLSILLVYLGRFFGPNGVVVAFILAVVLNWVSYFFGDKLVLAMTSARPISEEEYPQLHNIIAELSVASGLPTPKLYLIPSGSPNAFATGRDPQHASVAVTRGILELLDEQELKGVLAHEMSHIKNRDILLATIAATIASAITMLANMLRWTTVFGNRDSERGSNVFSLIAILVMSILIPIAAAFIQLAISRNREFLADETGARICRNPFSLASALRKLAHGVARQPMNAVNPSTSHLFIVNPFSAKSLLTLFSTHPPIEERIRRLENMAV
jgi:heat shock protein HtpX